MGYRPIYVRRPMFTLRIWSYRWWDAPLALLEPHSWRQSGDWPLPARRSNHCRGLYRISHRVQCADPLASLTSALTASGFSPEHTLRHVIGIWPSLMTVGPYRPFYAQRPIVQATRRVIPLLAMSTDPAARVEHPWGRGLLWDVGLGLVLSIMLIVVFSLMIRPHYWVPASVTGQ
jgi:hypothetical protein